LRFAQSSRRPKIQALAEATVVAAAEILRTPVLILDLLPPRLLQALVARHLAKTPVNREIAPLTITEAHLRAQANQGIVLPTLVEVLPKVPVNRGIVPPILAEVHPRTPVRTEIELKIHDRQLQVKIWDDREIEQHRLDSQCQAFICRTVA
jgi:hypothetical protein